MKRLSEEYAGASKASQILDAGRSELSEAREQALLSKFVLAAAAAAPAAVASGAGDVALAPAKSVGVVAASGVKLALVVTAAVTATAALWLYQRPNPEANVVVAPVIAVPKYEAQKFVPQKEMAAALHEPKLRAPVATEAAAKATKRAPVAKATKRIEATDGDDETLLAAPPQSALEPVLKIPEAPTAPADAEESATSEKTPSTLAEEAKRLRRVRVLVASDEWKTADRVVRSYRRDFPKGALAQDMGYLRLQVEARLRPNDFAQHAARFLEAYPQSPYRAKIDRLRK